MFLERENWVGRAGIYTYRRVNFESYECFEECKTDLLFSELAAEAQAGFTIPRAEVGGGVSGEVGRGGGFSLELLAPC